MTDTTLQIKNLKISLFLLRLGVLVVFFMWTIDKFINPAHTAAVFSNFYHIEGLSTVMVYIVGGVQVLILLAFFFGFFKRFSYGLLFLMHLVSTLSTFSRYLDPWATPNLLFFTAWPMLAALADLFLMRNEDTLFNIKT